MNRLNGKVAIVTGAAGGMGESHVWRFVEEGAKVLFTDIVVTRGEALATELGPSARFARHDVTSRDDWSRVVAEAEAAFGPVNVLVNNAGILGTETIENCTLESYRRLIETNQVSVFLGMKAVLASMRRAGGGSIINISSTGGLVGTAASGGYCDSKFALRGMSKVAAIEFGRDRIRVNTVHPGAVRTPMFTESPFCDQFERTYTSSTPLGRIGEPQEISNLVVFLASDESSFSTGSEFVADGGATAQ
jgi:3alpha(or 20beta)-hydroxysteroid dehydrogenase